MSVNSQPPEGRIVPATTGTLVSAGAATFAATRGFIPTADGTLTVDFAENGSGVTFPVNAGSVYPLSIKRVTAGPDLVLLR